MYFSGGNFINCSLNIVNVFSDLNMLNVFISIKVIKKIVCLIF